MRSFRLFFDLCFLLQKSSSSASSEASETCQPVSECSSPTTVSRTATSHSCPNVCSHIGIHDPHSHARFSRLCIAYCNVVLYMCMREAGKTDRQDGLPKYVFFISPGQLVVICSAAAGLLSLPSFLLLLIHFVFGSADACTCVHAPVCVCVCVCMYGMTQRSHHKGSSHKPLALMDALTITILSLRSAVWLVLRYLPPCSLSHWLHQASLCHTSCVPTL